MQGEARDGEVQGLAEARVKEGSGGQALCRRKALRDAGLHQTDSTAGDTAFAWPNAVQGDTVTPPQEDSCLSSPTLPLLWKWEGYLKSLMSLRTV